METCLSITVLRIDICTKWHQISHHEVLILLCSKMKSSLGRKTGPCNIYACLLSDWHSENLHVWLFVTFPSESLISSFFRAIILLAITYTRDLFPSSTTLCKRLWREHESSHFPLHDLFAFQCQGKAIANCKRLCSIGGVLLAYSTER